MTNPTPEQIEAAARAMCAARTCEWGMWSLHTAQRQDMHRVHARAALVAAAGAAPPEPAEDRVMMIAEHLAQAHTFTRADGEAIARAALKLAAPVRVDEAKLGDLIAATIREVDGDHTMGAGALGEAVAGAVSEWLRGGGR